MRKFYETPLVQRLRAWAEESELKQYSRDDVGSIRLVDELAEAANEIERLQDRNHELENRVGDLEQELAEDHGTG